VLAKDIRVGGVYRMFVSGYPTEVKVTSEHPRGGWIATNLQTGRDVRIPTAECLGPTYVPLPPSPRIDRWSD
jgi:hypothetical protein